MRLHCWEVLLLGLPKRRAQSCTKKVTEEATGSRREGGSLSESIYLWYGDDSFPPTSQQTKRFLPFKVHVAIFVLETKAHAMNYNHFKELSRNKRGLVRAEEVRRRNLKPCCGRKRSETNTEMKKVWRSFWAFDVSGSRRRLLLLLQAGQRY